MRVPRIAPMTVLVVLLTTIGTAPARAAGGVPELWSAGPFTAQLQVVAGDVNGDGADDIVSYNTYLYGNRVLLSTGSAFLPQQNWGNGNFYDVDAPGHANMVGDVNNDGRADAVMVRQQHEPRGISVAKSIIDYYGVSRFGTATSWLSNTIAGDYGNLIADLDGDGDSDVIGLFGHITLAARSNGTASAPLVGWGPPLRGGKATLAADATGDGAADLILVDATGVTVVPANPNWFTTPPQTWSATPFFGTKKTLTADIDADGDADLIAVNDTDVQVMRSTGTGYAAQEPWYANTFLGTKETLTADVDGDGDADLVAVNTNDVWVLRTQ
jgi:VCBS repeat protein